MPPIFHRSPRRRVATVFAVCLTFACSTLVAQAPPAWLDGFDAYVERAVADWEVPGLAVSVVVDGKTVFARGYGVLELGTGAPVDAETLFAAGSTTKAFTAASVALLVDEGKVDWDDPVIEHLPWFRVEDPVLTREITVRDLLTHRSGLGNADYFWYGSAGDPAELRGMVERLRHLPTEYSPRSGFVYQNLLYGTAGLLAAEVSGTPWGELVESRLLEPLGMERTTVYLGGPDGAERRPNVASPHDLVDGDLTVIDNASVDSVGPAGSIWSSVDDMGRWLAFLLRGCTTEDGTALLEPATCEELFTPQTIVPRDQFYPTAELTHPHWTTYGLAWFQHDYRGEKVDFHTGSIDGMVAIAGLLREHGIGIYVLANRDHAELRHALMYRLFDLALGVDEPRDWSAELEDFYERRAQEAQERQAARERIEGTSPQLPLEEYAGTYSDPLYGTVRVHLDDDGTLRAAYGESTGELAHWHHDVFGLHWDRRWRGTLPVVFVLGVSGQIERLEIGDWVFPRQSGAGGQADDRPTGDGDGDGD